MLCSAHPFTIYNLSSNIFPLFSYAPGFTKLDIVSMHEPKS